MITCTFHNLQEKKITFQNVQKKRKKMMMKEEEEEEEKMSFFFFGLGTNKRKKALAQNVTVCDFDNND